MDPIQTPTTDYIVPLGEVGPGDTARVGVKAANLATLLQAGFPVPEGVVLTTDAFNALAAGNRPSDVGFDAERVLAAKMPPEVSAHLAGAVAAMDGAAVAVRSSAVAEDLPDASFAGQYETALDVRSSAEIEEAAKRCWASAFSELVTAYRRARGLDGNEMAVIVQRMIEAEAAGVSFSANPVTGRRDEVLINAVRGLGERLVSGESSPDEWVVNGREARCERAPEDAIDADLARAIADLTRRVEELFGAPQDVEWAVQDGRLYVLQARPITSLPEPEPEPVPIPIEVPSGFWQYDASHGPRAHVPFDRLLLPMVRACSLRWSETFGYLFDGIEFREIGGWAYQRMIPLGDRNGPNLPTWLMRLLVRVVPVLRRRVATAVEAWRTDLSGRLIERWYEEWQPELAAGITRLRDTELASLSDGDLDRHLDSAFQLQERGLEIHMLVAGAMAVVLHEFATTCDELLGWDLGRAMDLVSGTSYKSTEPARRLNQLARMAAERVEVRRLLDRPDDSTVSRLAGVDPEFSAAFDGYLHEYGCRALGHTTASEPTLAEVPAVLLRMITGQLEHAFDAEETEANNARRRAEVVAEARSLLGDEPERHRRFEGVLHRAERAYPAREDNEFFTMSAPLALLRYAALEAGERLALCGVIESPEDVLFLEFDEVRAALSRAADLRTMVDRRKGEKAWAERHPGPPFYGQPPSGPPSFDFLSREAALAMEALIWSNEVIMALGGAGRSGRDADADFAGIAASPGSYTGPARVVMDESGFGLVRPGEVLVCPITSPVWSVLFPIIGALVTDTGGVLSHPAIIAREYGIPAVVAAGEATGRLHDGDVVTVDGSAGTVHVETFARTPSRTTATTGGG